jgi:uncharacterized membrane protein
MFERAEVEVKLLLLLAGALAMVVIAGCGSGDLTLDQADPDAVAANPTWDQVFGIFQRECAPCHTDDEGEDEPEDRTPGLAPFGGVEPDLQTCSTIIENLDRSLVRMLDDNDMPPGAWPRLTSEERLIVQRWNEQGAVAPCN